MYLFERLFGVGFFSCTLVLTCLLLSHYSNKKLFINMYYFLLLVMAYCFVPHKGADLTRIIFTMKAYARLSIGELFNILKQSTTPLAVIFYHIVGKFGNDHLLPFAAALISIGLNLKLIQNSRDDFKADNKVVALVLFVFMSRGMFLQTISNIRTIMSFSVASIAVYREMVRGERFSRSILLYLISATLHAMGIVILIYRLLFMFVIKGSTVNKMIQRIAVAVACVGGGLFVGQRYLRALSRKSLNYYISARIGEGYVYTWEGILSIISILLAIYILIINKKTELLNNNNNNGEKEVKILVRFLLPLIVIDIISVAVEFNFFHRMSWFIHIMLIPVYIKTLADIRYTLLFSRVRKNLIIISSIMLIIACARGDLCSLKFFVL